MRSNRITAAITAVVAASILAPLPAPAQSPNERTIRIVRSSSAPKLEDFLNGNESRDQAPVTDFLQRKPVDGAPVTRMTRAYLSYDSEHIYAVFVCKDRPEDVRARLSKRDEIFSDDHVGLHLDTFHDRRHSVSFYANPLGIQGDAMNTDGQEDDFGFDTVWQSRGRLTSDGFVVWMAIPFKSLRFPPEAVQTWGIGLSRFIPGATEEAYWPEYSERIDGFAVQLGTLEGIEHVSPGRNLQLIPYGVFGRSRFLDTPLDGPSFQHQTEHRGGLDSKVILKDGLTLDVTINPDFSQVESDDPQVTANQRFEVLFPEKRPFFLENAGYFSTPENLFFSRRIENPEYGARLTGKAGPWLIGLLAIDDRAPGEESSPDDPLRHARAIIGAARIQRQLGRESTLGLLSTRYGFGASSEWLLSADSRIKLTRNIVFDVQAVRSEQRLSGSVPIRGTDFYGGLVYSGLHFNSTTKYFDRSPGFNSRLGFIPRVDFRQLHHEMSYKWLPARAALLGFGPTLTASRAWNHGKEVQEWQVTPGVAIDFAEQTTLTVTRTRSYERFEGIGFRKHSTDVTFTTEAFSGLTVEMNYGMGARVNYFSSAGIKPFAVPGKDLSLTVTLRPTSRLKLDEIYVFTHLDRIGDGPVILNDHRLRSVLNYQFTKEASLRAIADYGAILPNAQFVDLERSKILTADLLFTYLLNPGTAVYLGYTDTRENLGIISGPPASLTRTVNPNTVTGRQFFAKLSYFFRF